MDKKISTSVVLLLFFISIYTWTMSGSIQYGDESEKYRVAQSIVDRQDFSFRPTAQRNRVGSGGRTYSVYELGQTLVEIPLYVAGRAVHHFWPTPDLNSIGMLLVGFLNPILTALTCVLLFRVCQSLGIRYRTSLVLAIVFGLGTIAWPYSKGFTREPLLGLLVLLTFYSVYCFAKNSDGRWLVVAGGVGGFLVFSKFIQAMLIPFFLAYVLVIVFQSQRQRGGSIRGATLAGFKALIIFLLPALFLLGIQSAYALVRFGKFTIGVAGTDNDPLQTVISLLGRSQPFSLAGTLLLSSDKSVFLYSPPILLSLFAWFKWRRRNPQEAFLVLGLVLITFVSTIVRPDGDGGSWWGPRYLVQITPLLIIPIGALLELSSRVATRFWIAMLALLSCIGLVVGAIGALSSGRDYLDITGKGTALLGQIDFLRHGMFDSLMVSLSPTGFPLQINLFGLVLLAIVIALGAWIVVQLRSGDARPAASPRHSVALLVLVLAIELAAFIAWIVAPYTQVLAAEGNTRFVAANSFLADGRTCEATASYLMAIERGTTDQSQAVARLNELTPRPRGESISANDLQAEKEISGTATLEEDGLVSISGDGSLKVSAAGENDVIARGHANPIPVLPNTTIEVSGWMKTENVYGEGFGSVTVSEDDGAFRNIRATDVVLQDETNGWTQFQKTITTLPTTRRLFVAAGLWKTFGTVWVDGLQIAQITSDNPPLPEIKPCN